MLFGEKSWKREEKREKMTEKGRKKDEKGDLSYMDKEMPEVQIISKDGAWGVNVEVKKYNLEGGTDVISGEREIYIYKEPLVGVGRGVWEAGRGKSGKSEEKTGKIKVEFKCSW